MSDSREGNCQLLFVGAALLAPPAANRLSLEGRRGQSIFAKVGCDSCHLPSSRLAGVPSSLCAKQGSRHTPTFSLHDVGPVLADICLGLAAPSEFRTQPLMGLSLNSRFLHEGGAATIEQAILPHSGEAAASRERFKALGESDRKSLLQFLRSF